MKSKESTTQTKTNFLWVFSAKFLIWEIQHKTYMKEINKIVLACKWGEKAEWEWFVWALE